jgi:hypothetical protein
MQVPGYAEFEIDIPAFFSTQLPEILNKMPAGRLTRESVQKLPAKAQGVYCLYLDGKLVYVGKTDAQHGFRDRLDRHVFSVQHRQHLDPNQVSFKAVRIFVFHTIDVEAILIKALSKNRKPDWQDSGFGSNDPGRQRDHQEPAKFDVRYPINVSIALTGYTPGKTISVAEALAIARDQVPYVVRSETIHRRQAHPDLLNATITPTNSSMTMLQLLKAAVNALPPNWQATIFPGRVILYRERIAYKHAVTIISSD